MTSAHKALQTAGAGWFAATVYGQLLFLIYIVVVYGRAALGGDLYGVDSRMPNGFEAGDGTGNAVLAGHLLIAAILTLQGSVQLMPFVRARWPRFHRWSGRIYLPAALMGAVGGLYLVWLRPGGNVVQATDFAISLNGLLIITCAIMAWRTALTRQFARHQVWAMRLFLVVSGVWFLRIGIMAWGAVNLGNPPGMSSMEDWFFVGWSFGSTLVPLAVYELWRLAKRSKALVLTWITTAVVAVSALAVLVGSTLAMMAMWWPYISQS